MYNAVIKNGVLVIKSAEDPAFECTVDGNDEEYDIFGIYGSILFNEHQYIILIDKAVKVAEIDMKPVFKVQGAKIYEILKNGTGKAKDSQKVKETLESFFGLPGIYFSDAELYIRRSGVNSSTYRDTFLFNEYAIKQFLSISNIETSEKLVLKCIQGYFGRYKELILISRRCPKRAGTRYFSRGLGDNNYVSNFVETEQIIAEKNSYLHLRGSIPLPWRHIVKRSYQPEIVIDRNISEKTITAAHELLEGMYSTPILYLNLIHSEGYEGDLFKQFNKQYSTNYMLSNYNLRQNIRNFKLLSEFASAGFTSVERAQEKVIRTNCIDCLDRTNLMQYFIGRSALEIQLADAGIESKEEYKEAFKILFYENGNNLSIQYAGTRAQSSYFITQGDRSFSGLLSDASLSIQRYFINRYSHGKLQNAYDILTGNRLHGSLQNRNIRLMHFKLLIVVAPIFFGGLYVGKPKQLMKASIFLLLLFYMLYPLIRLDYPMSYR
ncbi:hypothetical protein GINT2_000657 [Glugoides intestinalis]